jgi:hypothetical protein
MIAFFRNIRKSLLQSGQARKYILYAIGEITLVVIGILIALQINNWNEGIKKEATVNGHLKSLAKAVKQDVRELTISMEFSETRFHFIQYFLKISNIPFDSLPTIPRFETYIENHWSGPYPDTLDKRYIDKNIPYINNAFLGMVFNYSAINEINNLGILSELKDDSLKTMITEYYYFLDWRFGEQGVNKRYKLAEDLKNHLRDQHFISCTYPPNPLLLIHAIKEDEKLVIMLKDLAKTSHDHYWETSGLRDRAKKLVENINSKVSG